MLGRMSTNLNEHVPWSTTCGTSSIQDLFHQLRRSLHTVLLQPLLFHRWRKIHPAHWCNGGGEAHYAAEFKVRPILPPKNLAMSLQPSLQKTHTVLLKVIHHLKAKSIWNKVSPHRRSQVHRLRLAVSHSVRPNRSDDDPSSSPHCVTTLLHLYHLKVLCSLLADPSEMFFFPVQIHSRP